MKYLFFLLVWLFPVVGFCEVLYENNFDNKPNWESGVSGTGGLSTTHAEAVTIGFSEYMVGSDLLPLPLFSIGESYRRGLSGKGLAWRPESYSFDGEHRDMWAGGRVSLHFADPDIFPASVNNAGYEELWIRYWVNYQDFEWGVSPIFKIMRYYADAQGTNWDGVWNSSINGSLSSHYNPDGSYKEPHMITDWGNANNPYYLPTYCAEGDNDGGSHCVTRNSRPNKWFDDVVSPNNWHLFEHHIKMNDIGQANAIQDLYVDGNYFAGLKLPVELRTSSSAIIDHIILFDNHQLDSGGSNDIEQTILIDDLVISTSRLPVNYTIGDQEPVIINPPTLHEVRD